MLSFESDIGMIISVQAYIHIHRSMSQSLVLSVVTNILQY